MTPNKLKINKGPIFSPNVCFSLLFSLFIVIFLFLTCACGLRPLLILDYLDPKKLKIKKAP